MAQTFGQLIRDARVRRKLTVRDLSSLVGLAPGQLSEMELGKRLPSKDVSILKKMATKLQLDKEELINVAQRERAARSEGPKKAIKKMYFSEPELAMGLFRAVEEASDEDVADAMASLLERLKQRRSESGNGSSCHTVEPS